MRIEAAADRNLAEIEALLMGCGLPTAGLRDQFPAAYVVAIELGAVVGCAALETYEGVGLLRSCVVSADRQSQGIGRALVANRIDAAKAQKLEAVYLLTTTAHDYFVGLGFGPADRTQVPARLAACPEFASACPSSAACLSLSL
jgi:N-acetylglutamate synthase-like GNAT family acetyltransferase